MAKLISGVANDRGAIHLHKTTDGFRFFIKEEKYAFLAGVTLQEDELRQFIGTIREYFDEEDSIRLR